MGATTASLPTRGIATTSSATNWWGGNWLRAVQSALVSAKPQRSQHQARGSGREAEVPCASSRCRILPKHLPRSSATGPASRTGPSPYEESEYEALDRSAHAYAAQVRATLDQWFWELPAHAKASVHSNFISPKTSVHRGGLLELYLHETFRRLRFDIDLDIGREDPGCRRPDFLLQPGSDLTWI